MGAEILGNIILFKLSRTCNREDGDESPRRGVLDKDNFRCPLESSSVERKMDRAEQIEQEQIFEDNRTRRVRCATRN